MNMTKTKISTCRIVKDWNAFLYDQAGQIVAFKRNGETIDVKFPAGAKSTDLLILNGEVCYLEYYLNDCHVEYFSPKYYMSVIHENILNLGRKVAIC